LKHSHNFFKNNVLEVLETARLGTNASSGYPLNRAGYTWYPPTIPPTATIIDLTGDGKMEITVQTFGV
jgi:hypothetical protein